MRFHLGPIPESSDFTPDSSWRAMREPGPWTMQFIAVPIGLAAMFLVAFLWLTITPLPRMKMELSITGFLLAFAGIIIVHELLHAAVHPLAGRSPQSVLGFWPSRLLFYAAYTGELTRNRFVAVLLMPVVVISLAPLVVAALVQVNAGWAASVSAFNALLACGDIFGAGMVLGQVPATAVVRNQGWRTYWRVPGCDCRPVEDPSRPL